MFSFSLLPQLSLNHHYFFRSVRLKILFHDPFISGPQQGTPSNGEYNTVTAPQGLAILEQRTVTAFRSVGLGLGIWKTEHLLLKHTHFQYSSRVGCGAVCSPDWAFCFPARPPLNPLLKPIGFALPKMWCENHIMSLSGLQVAGFSSDASVQTHAAWKALCELVSAYIF